MNVVEGCGTLFIVSKRAVMVYLVLGGTENLVAAIRKEVNG